MESGDQPRFDVRAAQALGATVLVEGLSTSPPELTPSTSIPLAYWKTESFGIVIFHARSPDVDNQLDARFLTGQYRLRNDKWIPSEHWISGSLPGELEDDAIRWDGRTTYGLDDEGPALVVWGRCSDEVEQLSFVQQQDRITIPIGHLGTWVIGTERRDPWRVEALDEAGNTLGFINQDSKW